MNYALINTATGFVENTFVWDGNDDWSAPDGYEAIQSDEAGSGWTYANGVFIAPPVPPAIPPSPAEIFSANAAARDYFLALAALAIAPLQDAEDLDEATAQETVLLRSWKQYRVAVNRIDLTVAAPHWPVAPA